MNDTGIIKDFKSVFGKSLCDICLKETRVQRYDKLDVCSNCLKRIKSIKGGPYKIPKNQQAGGIKDDL